MGRTKPKYSALTISNTMKQMMDSFPMKREPVWYQPVLNTPPMTDFSRKPPQIHGGTGHDLRKLHPIQTGISGHIRRKFYTQHPWELARPKVVVEEDGADYARWDWSKIEQIGKPLDGER